MEEKVRFLSDPAVHSHRPGAVDVIETHMSWVFLAGSRVYKFKKPVAFPFLDHRSLSARRRNCEVEYQDNLALADRTYLGVEALRLDHLGRLKLGGSGRAVEWLVVMKRLDATLTLETKLRHGTLRRSAVESIAERMIAHYGSAAARTSAGSAYSDHLRTEHETNPGILLRPEFDLGDDLNARAVTDLEQRFTFIRDELEARIAAGLVVDGHGDLRPEHVWLGEPIQIFDRLEFDRNMRIIDPYDELNYLGLECAIAGAEWVRSDLLCMLGKRWGHPPSKALLGYYTAFRLVLRARICLAHLLDANPMSPEVWPDAARNYLTRLTRDCAAIPEF